MLGVQNEGWREAVYFIGACGDVHKNKGKEIGEKIACYEYGVAM